MFTNPYNPQLAVDRIDTQIAELQKMKAQIPPAPAINQTFQLAGNNGNMKFLNNADEVDREIVFGATPFFSKDMSVLWVKEATGEVKSYELKEIIKKDEKDLQIEFLMTQIEDLKGMIKNEQFNSNVNAEQVPTSTTTNDEPIGEPIKENKPTSISRVSTTKKK